MPINYKTTILKNLVFAIILISPLQALADVTVSGAEVAFSPGNSLGLVLNTIQGAKHSIRVAAYSFTSKPIALALLDAKRRGIDVRLVVDKKSNSGKYSAVTFFANQGVAIRLNSSYAIMHNKFMVIDGVTVETGSFNYTKAAAEKNAENVIVLEGVPSLALRYEKEWERLWSEAEEMAPRY